MVPWTRGDERSRGVGAVQGVAEVVDLAGSGIADLVRLAREVPTPFVRS